NQRIAHTGAGQGVNDQFLVTDDRNLRGFGSSRRDREIGDLSERVCRRSAACGGRLVIRRLMPIGGLPLRMFDHEGSEGEGRNEDERARKSSHGALYNPYPVGVRNLPPRMRIRFGAVARSDVVERSLMRRIGTRSK